MRLRGIYLVVLAAGLSGCGNSTGPTASPIVFVAGNHQTDTISATLSQPLTIRIALPPRGKSVARQLVQFQSVTDSAGSFEAYVQSLPSDTTDSLGFLNNVVIVLGTHAGPAGVVVSVPAFGYTDTARFTVRPGRVAALVTAPTDTAAYVGGTVALRAYPLDRAGNRRTDPVTFSVASGPATISGSTATVTGIGRVAVLGSVQAAQDTVHLYGVPHGTIGGSSDSVGIVVFNLDGADFKEITSQCASTVRWAPSGTSLIFDQYGCNATSLVQTVQLNGTISVVVSSPSFPIEMYSYSHDASWIYYVDAFSYGILRVHPDGTGNTRLTTMMQSLPLWPNPSPDGTSLVFVMNNGCCSPSLINTVGNIYVMNLSTLALTPLPVFGAMSAYWSPTSSTIAFVNANGGMSTMNADGTNIVSLARGPYDQRFDWSPDGKWIIARNVETRQLEVINASSGLVLPIGYVQTVGSPTWH